MALISKIREKTGLAVGVITVGLALFLVGGDLLGPNSILKGNSKQVVGEIAGQKITLQEYQQEVDELKRNFALRNGRNPGEAEMNTIRNQAWQSLVSKIAYGNEYDELGISVPESEIIDMVQGNHIQPEIKQAFTNPETGEFSKQDLINYLKNLGSMPPQQQVSWQLFEQGLEPGRLRMKYENMLLGGSYATDIEAEKAYKEQNETVNVKYLYIPYYSINDTTISVSDSELKQYLAAHAEEFKTQESRVVEYVEFPITPSEEDKEYFNKEIKELKTEFEAEKTVKEDSIFAKVNTDNGLPVSDYTVASLPRYLTNSINILKPGSTFGPSKEGEFYTLYKVLEITQGDQPSARASHILFKVNGDDDAKVKAEAQKVLNQIKKGASFAEMAKEHGQDGTASRGGDLGWFGKGRMVEPFENAVFDAKKTGLLPKLVKTQFGYHIIDVTETANSDVYKIASIQRELSPSDKTIDEAYRKADFFASTTNDYEEFKANAEKDGLKIETANNVQKNDRRLGSLGNARQAVSWAYRDGRIGEISPAYEIDGNFIVLTVTTEVEEGTSTVDQAKDQLTIKVKNDKKAEQIIAKLKGKNGALNEVAIAYGSAANVFTKNGVKLADNSLPNAGYVPELVGAAFGLNAGQKSGPIKLDNGVAIIEVVTKAPGTEAKEEQLKTEKQNLASKARSRASYGVNQAIQKNADVKDERYRYY
ncbi:SurA N-terminal domain-containing protein [Aureibacter tunicatorum]|uniref:Periplasmic chaperone PpiD n=1 Tax=Aureibacter tunicatorum TaxID=866807 RepID=A0AAE3XKG2_9BACT|nr:SurA N-terminal domain-containing protein [Aureibacter tunicatorum]MDR6237391.1 peptidyl-prolyl cis-trans isomerase D [Aureibacter tunicatorum]BDD06381.1 peptidylprolyl isomerase [Aureibacter tunicatorum]